MDVIFIVNKLFGKRAIQSYLDKLSTVNDPLLFHMEPDTEPLLYFMLCVK